MKATKPKAKKVTKKLSAKTKVFAKNPKKTEPDDMPGKMRGGNPFASKLRGKSL